MIKFVAVLTALVAAVHGSIVQVDNDAASFSYDVADPITGDYKSQVESRVGGVVRGQYSLIDPDGTKRVVDYTADDINGFNAVVRKEPVVAPVVASRTVVSPVPSVLSSPSVYSRSYTPSVYSTYPSVYSSVYPTYKSPYYSSYGYPTANLGYW